jgi:hypothetical protein
MPRPKSGSRNNKPHVGRNFNTQGGGFYVNRAQEEIEVDDDDLLQSDDVSEGNEENYRKHKKYKLKKDIHHQTESIGHNTLEHETFSMGQ